MQECAARARLALKTFPEAQLPFEPGDVSILEGTAVDEVGEQTDSMPVLALETALRIQTHLRLKTRWKDRS